MRKKSFVNEMLIYLMILTVLLVGVLGIFLVSSYYVLESEIEEASEAFVDIYSNEYSNTLKELDGILTNISIQALDLEWISNDDADKRSLSAVSLSNFLQGLLYSNETADVVVIYDANYEVNIESIKMGVKYDQKLKIKDFTAQAVKEKSVANNTWDFVEIGDEMYIYKMLIRDSRAIAVFSSTTNLLDYLATKDLVNRSIVLANQSGLIGKVIGALPQGVEIGSKLKVFDSKVYSQVSREVVVNQLYAYCYTSKDSVLFQAHSSMIVVAVGASLAVFFMGYILFFTRRQIALPMHTVVNEMEKIKDGKLDNRINGEFRNKEFDMLQETTNQMVDQIVGLKIESYERRLELKEVELKSIRLQLKPHFFLNALSTISSLSKQNKNDEIKQYIEALSKNVRYIFGAGFHTVTVKNEIKHVENYIEMQELKYPGCVFHMVELPNELESWEIPQMLIHTFVENIYKYAISIDMTLMLLIKVSLVKYQEEDMLQIEIEDDGVGYPEDVLDMIESNNKSLPESGTRIGLLSIKRMMELMYERDGLIKVSNVKPHGCLSKVYVPRKAKHTIDSTYTRE